MNVSKAGKIWLDYYKTHSKKATIRLQTPDQTSWLFPSDGLFQFHHARGCQSSYGYLSVSHKTLTFRLSSPEVDAEGSEISSTARLWRPVKDLITPSNFEVCKTS